MNVSIVALVIASLACASFGRRTLHESDHDSLPQQNAQHLADEIKAAMARPSIQAEAKRISEQVAAVLADKSFQEQVEKVAAQVKKASSGKGGSAHVQPQTHSARLHPHVEASNVSTSKLTDDGVSASEPQSLAEHMRAMLDSPDFLQETLRLASELKQQIAGTNFQKEAKRAHEPDGVMDVMMDQSFQEDLAQLAQQMKQEASSSSSLMEMTQLDAQGSAKGMTSPLKTLALFLLAFNPAAAFNLPSVGRAPSSIGITRKHPVTSGVVGRNVSGVQRVPVMSITEGEDVQPITDETDLRLDPDQQHLADSALMGFSAEAFKPTAMALGLATLAALQPEAALAKGGEYGIFEGRIVSLAHPAVMGLMYGASAYSAFTGYQWRRLRELGAEIKDLKGERKVLQEKIKSEEEVVREKINSMSTGDDGEPEGADYLQKRWERFGGHVDAMKKEVATLDTKIDALSAERKELANADIRDKHYQMGSVILGLGTAFAIEGPVNTFLRAQKLFPGPHLYAGAGVVVSWALAASLVPKMQKGENWAREAHIAFNALALGLFTWQLPTGWEIMLKVIKNTKLP